MSQPQDKMIPHKNKDGTLDWNYNEEFICCSDSISLNFLKRYGGISRIKKGFIFITDMDYIFKDYLEPIIEGKILQDNYKSINSPFYNLALRECLKLLMNSLSGKMGQLPISNDKLLCDTKESCNKFINRYNDSVSITRAREGY